MSNYRTVVSFGCVHVPHANWRAVDELRNFVRSSRPDDVVCLGDLLDCYDLSSFDFNPEMSTGLLKEVADAQEVLMSISKSSAKTRCHYTPGNHERRLHKYLIRRAPALSGLKALKIENLLGLKEMGWKFHDLGAEINKGWVWMHGESFVSKDAGNTARRHVAALQKNAVIAHSHRQGIVRVSSKLADLNGVESGCMCRMDLGQKIWEVPPARMVDWQVGFAEVVIHKRSGKLLKGILHAV